MIDRFALICPSRGRPRNVKRLARSIARTSTNARLIVVLDDDDEKSYRRLSGVQYIVGPRVGFVGSANLALEAAAEYGFIGCVGDDVVFRTKGWDDAFIRHMRRIGPAICYGNDLYQREHLPTHWFVSARIVDALGWIALPELVHLFADNVWKAVGNAIGRLEYFEEIIIEHRHYACGKARLDEVYEHPSAGADHAVFEHFEKHRLSEVVERLRPVLSTMTR